ncbi:MAG: phytanoyl-CoA dioxygenase family protein [Anaerolineae bacterium]|nr:phytanoyl-CoA dioxygenase family protein [Anaerolineae bacterium]MDW8099930.1 phytanoyl-CoA dioxygenase family protein [Anaerolineae bacterium]
MATQVLTRELSISEREQFEREGYLLIPGLLSPSEVQELIETMTAMHASAPIPELNYYPLSAAESGGDVLKQYPRIMHPHRVNETAKRYMLHPRIISILTELFGEEPLAAQSMFYFKPPGARGQSLHQDNFYLRVEPGTCIAAWVALEPADEENGGLIVVPKTNHLGILCPHQADPAIYFTKEEVDVPEGLAPITVPMEAGDVLFFNGSLIHGSPPNRSRDRWRRSFICHYVGVSSLRIGNYYNPLYTIRGEIVRREDNGPAGPCGTEFSSLARSG